MKKSFLFLAAAALVLASCNNDVTVAENQTLANEPQEIAFTPLSTPVKRAPVDGAVFPTASTIEVAAYDATAGANYFGVTTFSNVSSTTTWTGGKYWPFKTATINFLAYTELTSGSATWNATNPASDVTLVMGDNKTAQKDLMYACGTGTVTQSGNTFNFPASVPMTFKHAQAWIKFTVKAGDATSASAITVNSIKLNSVSCQGTFTVTHANWNSTSEARSVSGTWSAYDTYAGNVDAIKATGYSTLSTSAQDYANLMVVPAQGIASFTINFTLDNNTYDYTYTPASTSLAQATKYTYNITLTAHEIVIVPTVADWTPNDFDTTTDGQQDQDVSI